MLGGKSCSGLGLQLKRFYMICRPVDCDTRAPLAYLPGFISETIYTDNIETGWAWFPYMQNNKQLQVHALPFQAYCCPCYDVISLGNLVMRCFHAEQLRVILSGSLSL